MVSSAAVPDWIVAHWAQIVTDTISCEQSQGPPAITDMTSRTCSLRGGLVTVKGKNLESKADDQPNVKVKVTDKESGWTGYAKVCHKVTTPNSLSFHVPVFRQLKQREVEDVSLRSIPIALEISVDDRASDSVTDFAYAIPRQQHAAKQQNAPLKTFEAYDPLGYDDVLSVLNEVERVNSNPQHGNRLGGAAVQPGTMTHDVTQFPQQMLSIPPEQAVWKTEPGNSSCMATQSNQNAWTGYQDQSGTQNAELVLLQDSNSDGWTPTNS